MTSLTFQAVALRTLVGKRPRSEVHVWPEIFSNRCLRKGKETVTLVAIDSQYQ